MLASGGFDSNTGIWTRNERAAKQEDRFGDEDGGSGGEENGEEEEEWAFSSLLTGPDSEIKCVAFSPTNSALLATSSRDKSVWVWEDVADSAEAAAGGFGRGGAEDNEFETVAVLAEHTGDVKCVAWHPGREVLASGSYDDTVRLWRDVEEEGGWCCVGVLEGHEGTVWGVAWEPLMAEEEDGSQKEPRLASCSDDLTIRIWRNMTEQKKQERTGPRMPSIIRPASSMESWIQEGALPQMHFRSIYAIAWSSVTGLIVSCGGDGGIYVYKEKPVESSEAGHTNGEAEEFVMNGTEESETAEKPRKTKWVVVAQIEGAHAEYEINHVCWARRQDRGKRHDEEEVIVSSGDDGVVRVWTLPKT